MTFHKLLLFLLLTLKKLTPAGLLFAQIINYSLGELEADGNLLTTITLDFSISITYFYIYHLFHIHHFYWKNNRVFQTLAPYCH